MVIDLLLMKNAMIMFRSCVISNDLATINKSLLSVIDEISMVPPGLLTRLDISLRQTTHIDQPFGNLHVIIIGDMLQIEPVDGKSLHIALVETEIKKMKFDNGASSNGVQLFRICVIGRFSYENIKLLHLYQTLFAILFYMC